MKLEEVRIKNFRAFKEEVSIPISSLTTFIGKNDIGKSSILEALEIFFNNGSLVTCEREDLSVETQDNDIEITCIFADFPNEIVIDSSARTCLKDEHLLNSQGKLEIKKSYTCTTSKPKERVFIQCIHPSNPEVKDLLTLKRKDLVQKAQDIGVDANTYNASVNSQIRKAIWANTVDLRLENTALLVDEGDTRKIFEELRKYLPTYALFQSDRQSKDDDKEITDPMKVAVMQALREVESELNSIKETVRRCAIETAQRTLIKLKEMDPDLASSLIPDFRAEPKFESQFKLTLKSDNNIPINKRGSGVRRLILLNFFRAEAERRMMDADSDSIIYAFEEPETSQHPSHQQLLIDSFLALSNTENCQVILTTHTPSLAGFIPLSSLRYIEMTDAHRTIRYGSNDVYQDICDSLGLLPGPLPLGVKALVLVEGKADVIFLHHTAEKLKEAGYIPETFKDKSIGIIPTGGCDNLRHWCTLKIIDQFQLPWCALLDSDKGTPKESKNKKLVEKLRRNGIKAYTTRKRELENYIHPSCIENSSISFSETDDVKKVINSATKTATDKVLEKYWPLMTGEQIRLVEQYDDKGIVKNEFTDMILDFLSLV